MGKLASSATGHLFGVARPHTPARRRRPQWGDIRPRHLLSFSADASFFVKSDQAEGTEAEGAEAEGAGWQR